MKWRIVAALVILAVAGWSGWWVIAGQLKRGAIEAWLAERRADGWVAEAEAIETAGFPNRIDTRVSGLSLADPAQGWAYATPFVDMLMLTYRPNAAILALPSGQTFAVPGARAELDSETLRGSVSLVPGTALEIAALSVEGASLVLTDAVDAATLVSVDEASFHLRALDEAAAPPNGYAMHAALDRVRLPEALVRRLDPRGVLPEVADSLLIDGRLAFDAPLDRRTVEQAPPGITHLALTTATVRWGDVSIGLSGALTADGRGRAEGALDLEAARWRDILAGLVRVGAIGEDVVSALEFGLGFFASERNGVSVIAVPLRFSGGQMWLGPIPVGRAPRLRQP